MSLILHKKSLNHTATETLLEGGKKQVLRAEVGARYEVIDSATGKAPAKLVVKRAGHALRVEVDGEHVLDVQEYFGDTTPADPAYFDINPAAASDGAQAPSTITLTPASAPLGAIEDTFLLYPTGEEIAAWAAVAPFNPWLAGLLLLPILSGFTGGSSGGAAVALTKLRAELADISDTGVKGDGQTDDTTPTIKIIGDIAPGVQPKVMIDGKPVTGVYNPDDKTFTPDVPVPTGNHEVTVTYPGPDDKDVPVGPPLVLVINPSPPTTPPGATDDKPTKLGPIVEGMNTDFYSRDGVKRRINYAWPLEVGKKWSYEYVVDTIGANGQRNPVETKVSAEVVGWESITTPAGTFKTIKVVHVGTFEYPATASGPSKMGWTFWYAPQVGSHVKSTYFTDSPAGLPGVRTTTVMTSFKSSGEKL